MDPTRRRHKQDTPSTTPANQRLLCERTRLVRGTLLLGVTLLVSGCGTVYSPSAGRPRQIAKDPWPSAADYGTIRTAAAVRDQALFHERDWRRKSYAASLALRTLLTVRLAPGPCATYVTELYGNLRDLADAYPGENWRPLVRLMLHQTSIGQACRQPGRSPTG
jgi:hypothetical protein